MTDLSAEFKALANYRPTNKVRFVTAASLFDGHDAAINIMRRILQGMGAEVIHLGHNRSVEEIRQIIGCDALIYQDVDGMKKAISSLNSKITGFDASCFDGIYVTGDISAESIELLYQNRPKATAEDDEMQSSHSFYAEDA